MRIQSFFPVSLLATALLIVACNADAGKAPAKHIDSAVLASDNEELKRMAEIDQQMRIEDKSGLAEQDVLHRKRLFELLAMGKVVTPKDKLRAALLLQHTDLFYCEKELKSTSVENYYLAYQLSKSAAEAGDTTALYFSAVAYDRYLSLTEGYQKYGTQKFYDQATDAMLWAPIDSSTSDAERARFNIPPLAELLKQAPMKPFSKKDSH